MICDDHQVTDFKVWIHTARGIGYEECLDAQFVHDADRECYLFHIIALIIMEAAFHSHNIFSSKFSEDQLAGMTFNSGDREIRNIFVREFITVSYFGS